MGRGGIPSPVIQPDWRKLSPNDRKPDHTADTEQDRYHRDRRKFCQIEEERRELPWALPLSQ